MALLTGRYPSFVGGVSQQDDSVRGETQLTEAVNTWLHAAMGAGKRPPAEFVMQLAHDVNTMACFHSIVRDAFERYIVAVENGNVRVFNHTTGYEYDVVWSSDEDAKPYLQTPNQPWSVFKCMTIADTTFIVNTEKVVKLSLDLSPGNVAGAVQTFNDLPRTAAIGTIYAVSGAEGNTYDNFYVQRSGSGVWLEIANPGIRHAFDKTTMPLVLKRIPDPTHGDGFFFSCGTPDWEVRLAGDENTNPPPSFVDERITDVFHHRGRLGFLSTENCCLSEVDHEFNFWRTSVVNLLDSDPVDFSVVTNGVASLRHAISFQSALLLFGDRGNFQMTAEPFLTPKTAKVDQLVSYECSRFIRPHMLGESLYFAADSGKFATIREYFVDDVSITGDAADVTAHCPRYIPGMVRAMASASEADILFVAPVESPSQIYAYAVRWAGNEKQQSAWCRWDISGVGRVAHMHVIDEYLYVVAQSPVSGVELLRFPLSLAAADADFVDNLQFHLDRLVVVQPNYVAFGNSTDFYLPYIASSLDDLVFVRTDDWSEPGEIMNLAGATLLDGGTRVRLPGNHAAGRVAIGLNYDCRITLTRPYVRDNKNDTILVGRTQVRDITVAYKDAAYFEVEVETRGRDVDPQRYMAGHNGLFTARVLGDEAFRLDAPVFHSGERRFPVLSRSDQVRITLVNRLPYQAWFLSAQFRAMFTSRSRV